MNARRNVFGRRVRDRSSFSLPRRSSNWLHDTHVRDRARSTARRTRLRASRYAIAKPFPGGSRGTRPQRLSIVHHLIRSTEEYRGCRACCAAWSHTPPSSDSQPRAYAASAGLRPSVSDVARSEGKPIQQSMIYSRGFLREVVENVHTWASACRSPFLLDRYICPSTNHAAVPRSPIFMQSMKGAV